MCERDEEIYQITAAYMPLDTVVTPCVALDIWMLVVAVLLKIKSKKLLSVRSRFTQRQVVVAIEDIEHEALKMELKRLVCENPLKSRG